jgi:hypothetical protein
MIYHARSLDIEQFPDLAGFDILEAVVIAARSVIAADALCLETAPDAGQAGQVITVLSPDSLDRTNCQQAAQHHYQIASFHFSSLLSLSRTQKRIRRVLLFVWICSRLKLSWLSTIQINCPHHVLIWSDTRQDNINPQVYNLGKGEFHPAMFFVIGAK